MKPYFESGGITLYVADSRDVVPSIATEGVDLIITDPPYGVNATATGKRVRQLALDSIANDDDTTVGEEIVSLAWPKLRHFRHAYVFGPFNLSTLPHSCGHCELIWDKGIIGMGDLAAPWGPQHEPIQFAIRADGPSNAKGHGGRIARMRRGTVLRHRRHSGSSAKYHIADKPVPLLRELIEMSSLHGEVVLDPFAGSGSTLVAAMMEGRRAIGIELEEPWAEVAAKRLDEMTRQPSLFGVAANGDLCPPHDREKP